MKTFTRESLEFDLKNISTTGWVANYRTTSSGNVGNVLEDLLGIEENNLQLPDAGEYEIKAQKVRLQPSSLLTLFHSEPEPRSLKVVPFLLETFGWEGNNSHRSFRQTISAKAPSDRGFYLDVVDGGVRFCWDENKVSSRHEKWLSQIADFTFPDIRWKFDDLKVKLEKKLKNCFYVVAASKQIGEIEHFKYADIVILEGFSMGKFIDQLKDGNVYVDFNARVGHNHGTAFRTRQNISPLFYSSVTQILK